MYIDAINDSKNDRIHVVERTSEGKRTYKEFLLPMFFITAILRASIVLSITILSVDFQLEKKQSLKKKNVYIPASNYLKAM